MFRCKTLWILVQPDPGGRSRVLPAVPGSSRDMRPAWRATERLSAVLKPLSGVPKQRFAPHAKEDDDG
jgi:hypothetical protein